MNEMKEELEKKDIDQEEADKEAEIKEIENSKGQEIAESLSDEKNMIEEAEENLKEEIIMDEDAVSVAINMTSKALFNFMIVNSFKKAGIIVWIVGLVALILLPIFIYDSNYKMAALMGIVVFLNLISKPIRFKSNSKLQLVQNESFKHPIEYKIGKSGVFISQFVGDGLIKWEEVFKVEERKKIILLYLTETQAFILIKDQMSKEDIVEVKKVVKNVDGLSYKLKGE